MYEVEITLQAETVLNRPGRWGRALKSAITEIAYSPEPDGVSKFVAPVSTGYSGCLLCELYPWRIFYQIVGGKVVIVAIAPHPTRL